MRGKINSHPGGSGRLAEPPISTSVMETMRTRTAAMRTNIHPAIEGYKSSLPFRRYPRRLFSVPVTVRHLCREGVRALRGVSLDLGEGGLGALVDGVLVGDTVALDFQLSDRSLKMVAIVRHACSARCGFEFVGLTAVERKQIVSIVGHT